MRRLKGIDSGISIPVSIPMNDCCTASTKGVQAAVVGASAMHVAGVGLVDHTGCAADIGPYSCVKHKGTPDVSLMGSVSSAEIKIQGAGKCL